MRQRLEEHSYLFAVFVAIAALIIHVSTDGYFAFNFPFLFFYAAVAGACWLGGAGPGVVATAILAAGADFFLIEPTRGFVGKDLNQLGALLAFILESLVICGFFHLLYKARLRLRHSLEACELARDTAEEANNMKRSFIANMSHEIRAPLSAVLGYSDVLAGENISRDERESYRERLKLNAAALTQLVTDLLDVTEINSGSFVANQKRFVLTEFMEKAYGTFAPVAQEKGLEFQVQLHGQIPAYVDSDPEQLKQILRHVIGNAIRFSEHGLIKLTVSASKTETGRQEIALIVSDQGPGIETEVRSKIFKPFSEDVHSLAKTHSGTGWGLTIARKLARGLGGDVKLVKSNRRGTTFLVTFDAGTVDAEHELIDHLDLAFKVPEIAAGDPHALDGVRVLLVDDSADAALLVSRMLKVAGASVETADRGQTGLEKARSAEYDLILMDIQMPEMDGYEAIRRLRALDFRKPIIALSAHAMKEDQAEAMAAGADEYLTKPVSRRALLEMVARYALPSRPHKRERITSKTLEPVQDRF